ncbi:MAG: cell wall metabolism sensor histidine kinase WalK [Lactobacillaceae bacterium]|nr:cell wall metabolism sensor histidine kinase WalK [Lactobacillaceae bacterium]
MSIFALLILIGVVFTTQYRDQTLDNFKSQIKINKLTRNTLASNLQNTNKKESNSALNSTLSSLTAISQNDDIVVIDNEGKIRAATAISFKQNVGSSYNKVYTNTLIQRNIQRTLLNNNYRKAIEVRSSSKQNYIVSYPLLQDKQVIGAVFYFADMTNTYDRMQRVTGIFLQSLFIPLVMMIGFAYLISRWLSRPLELLDEQTQAMIEGDYSVSNLVSSNDEIGRLASRINELRETINVETENSRLERSRLESLLSNMTDGVLAVNREGIVTIANLAASDLLGVDPNKISGTNVADLLQFERNGLTLRQVMQASNGITIEGSPEQDITYRVTASLIRRQSGFITGAVFVLRDVTEEVELEQQQKDFVSNVSHELRTPLTSVNSIIETLEDGALDQRNLAMDFLGTAHNETQRMTRMINDLLELSRIDQNNLKLDLEFVNVSKFLDYILNRFEVIVEQGNTIHDKKYVIEKKYKDKGTIAEIDPDKFTQVIDNIVNNAINYSPDGSVISVDMKTKNNNLLISISDKGIGIPRKDLKNVFNRFYRVDKARARRQGGSGLGLSISKEVVQALGGKIWAESKEGKGTTIFVSLPVVEQEEEIGE